MGVRSSADKDLAYGDCSHEFWCIFLSALYFCIICIFLKLEANTLIRPFCPVTYSYIGNCKLCGHMYSNNCLNETVLLSAQSEC